MEQDKERYIKAELLLRNNYYSNITSIYTMDNSIIYTCEKNNQHFILEVYDDTTIKVIRQIYSKL